MPKISKTLKKVLVFWEKKIRQKNFVVWGADFPNEYVRKLLQKEDLIFPIKKGLYLLKNKGEDAENLVLQNYWIIVEKILKDYEPWSIEKDSALSLHLGEESVPQRLLVHTKRRVKYSFSLPFGLEVEIRPDSVFHEEIRKRIEVGNAKIYLDVPEKTLFSLRKREGIKFIAFMKSMKFDRRMLEVLYSLNPKPIVIKELIKIAEENNRSDLSRILKDILSRYTIYRP